MFQGNGILPGFFLRCQRAITIAPAVAVNILCVIHKSFLLQEGRRRAVKLGRDSSMKALEAGWCGL